jgi:hypothetical protein
MLYSTQKNGTYRRHHLNHPHHRLLPVLIHAVRSGSPLASDTVDDRLASPGIPGISCGSYVRVAYHHSRHVLLPRRL